MANIAELFATAFIGGIILIALGLGMFKILELLKKRKQTSERIIEIKSTKQDKYEAWLAGLKGRGKTDEETINAN